MKVTTDSCLFGAWVAREICRLSVSIHTAKSLLDIGSGTGLLSLMLAQKNSLIIDAIEIDSEAANQAAENVSASQWQERITVINDDVLRLKPEKKYDVIVSNPPFYEQSLKSDKALKNTAHHSTQLNLASLLHFIKMNLADDGIFFLLLPYQRLAEFQMLATQQGFFLTKISYVRQSILHTPFRIMVQASFTKKDETEVEEVSIRDGQNQYTQAFAALLKDYYFYL